MKTILFTGHDAAYAPLAAITVPRMAEYADRHGFDFACLDFSGKLPAPWYKVPHTLRLLDKYDTVIWLDSDQLLTNFDVVPPSGNGLNLSLDWGVDATEPGHFNTGAYVAGQDARSIFKWVLDRESEYACGDFWEQAGFRKWYMDNKDMRDIVTVHGRRVFNSVPALVHESAPEPWCIGDWCAHVTMVDLPRRIQIAKEILASL
jgi:hypothetical protein